MQARPVLTAAVAVLIALWGADTAPAATSHERATGCQKCFAKAMNVSADGIDKT